MYDSFLYGYGLTLYVLDKISCKVNDSNPCKPFLDINNFWTEFFNADKHSKILRDFNKYFNMTEDVIAEHNFTRDFARGSLNDIIELGFERWVSKKLFDNDNRIPKGVQFYMYSLYNYWYNILHHNILNGMTIQLSVDNISNNILNHFSTKDKIFTTNYDQIFDATLCPQHIHGRFIVPLLDLNQLMMVHFNDKEFEYPYLFGTSGIEKLSRLNSIKDLSQNYYDLDFFYNQDLYFDHLLIFGLSLGKAEMMSESFLAEYPSHNNFYLGTSVEGHILLNLEKMYDDKRLNRITISYYSEDELKYYQTLLEHTSYNNVVDYISSDKLFIN